MEGRADHAAPIASLSNDDAVLTGAASVMGIASHVRLDNAWVLQSSAAEEWTIRELPRAVTDSVPSNGQAKHHWLLIADGEAGEPEPDGGSSHGLGAPLSASLASISINPQFSNAILATHVPLSASIRFDGVGDEARWLPPSSLSASVVPLAAWTKPVALTNYPLTGTIAVTQGYGGDTSHNINPWSVDFSATSGTGVLSVASGTVVSIRTGSSVGDAAAGGYGNFVTILQAGGFYATYAHLTTVGVSVNQSVGAGTQIGTSGATGATQGPHIHVHFGTGTTGTTTQGSGDVIRANGSSDAVAPAFFAGFFGSDQVGTHVDVNNPSTILATDIFGTGNWAGSLSTDSDELRGNDLANRIFGGGGPDRLYGFGGDDLLVGGSGQDYLDGGTGSDTASVANSNASWVIDLVHGTASAEGVTETLVSIENITGSSAGDTITLASGSVDNVIDGGGGSDRVILPYNFGQGYSVSGTVTNILLTGTAGTDRFLNVETYQFADGTTKTAAELLGPPSAPEIAVSGNSVNIVDGDNTPSLSDNTDFGSVALGGAVVTHTFTVTNSGTATLTTSGLSLPAGFTLVESLSASIAPGSSDTFTVQLDTGTTGTKSGQISFTDNDSDENPFNFSITGTVTTSPNAPEIAVSGNSVNIVDGDNTPSVSDNTDFGNVTQGGSAVTHTFTVTNSGTATLTTSGLSLPAGFTLVESLSSSIAAGSSDTFTVRLDTSSLGAKSGQISFIDNDSDENPFNFSITGTVGPGGGGSVVAGFDTSLYPGDSIMAWLRANTNLSWVGYYLYPAPSRNVNHGTGNWTGHNSTLVAQGWTVAPIYIGEQDPDSAPGEIANLSTNPSAAKGTLDGNSNETNSAGLPNSAVPLLHADGFSSGTIIYLDIETSGPQSQPEQDYIVSWCTAVAAAGFTPGIYCLTSAYASIAAVEPNVPYWIANPNHNPNTTTSPFPTPDPSGSGVGSATAWQFWDSTTANPYTISTPFGSVNVDLDSIRIAASSAPEIAVSGNSANIVDGDSTPSASDNTDFGSVAQGGTAVTHTFTVTNSGTATLTTSSLSLPVGFTLIESLSSSIAPGSSDTFTVQLDTGTTGVKSGQISFTDNDSDENPFNFSITGTVSPPNDDYDDNINTAGSVTAGGAQVLGNIERLGDRDWFRLQVVQGWTYTVNLDGGSPPQVGPFLNDPKMYLYDSSGGLVDSNDDANGGLNSQLTFVAGYTGAYFVGAGAFNDGGVGTYRVLASGGIPPNAPEIAVSGNSVSIVDGDNTPSASDNTDFGSVTQGGSAVTHTFTVTNSGTATLTTSGLSLPAGFTLVESLTASIAPGSSDTFTVQLDTTATGTKSGQISFADNDSDENPFNFSITGTVSPPTTPEIAVSGNSVNIVDGDSTPSVSDNTDFGGVTQGGAVVTHTFTVTNSGTATLTTSGLSLPAGFTLVESLSASIAPGSSDTFTVQLDTGSLGTKSGQISFTDNDSDENPFNFSITGTVNPPTTPEIAVSGNGANIVDGDSTPSVSDNTDFGNATQGGSAITHTFTVTNSGTGTLTTSGLSLPVGFTLVESLSASIAPGSSDTFTVQLDTGSTGTKSGQISFTDNDSDENPFNFSITGTVDPPPTPEIAVSGNAVNIVDGDSTPSASDSTDFGSVTQGGAVVTHTFTVTNSGTATLTTSGLSLPAGFTLVEGLSGAIAPGTSDTFTVQLDTGSAGTKSGQISFSDNDSDENPFNFSITGTVNALPSDLTATTFTFDGVNAHFSINNVGAGAAAGSLAGVYLSTDATVSSADIPVASVPTPPLAAGSGIAQAATVAFPGTLAAGAYYLGAVADSANALAESNEGNNGSNAIPLILGNDADNSLTGTSGDDIIISGNGDDTLNGGAGNDRLDGGVGNDTASYVGSLAAHVDLRVGGPQNTDYAGFDTLVGIENVIGSDSGGDFLVGDDNANKLYGQGGDDILQGNGGNDTLDGGAGNDTASYEGSLAAHVDLRLVGPQNTDYAGFDTLTGIENVTGSNSGGDLLVGDDNANVLKGLDGEDNLQGNGGTDTLVGGAGNDLLAGGNGDDTLYGGLGNDVLDGGSGNDTVSYEDVLAAHIDLRIAGPQNTDYAGLDTLAGIENVTGSNSGGDLLVGDDNTNVLKGLGGADNLQGNGGDDILYGGLGNDILDGGSGNDTASYEDVLAAHVDLRISGAQNTDYAGLDTLTGIENVVGSNSGGDLLVGDDNANVLKGLGGADSLQGNGGNDVLYGGLGNDTLDGGAGNDTASYEDVLAAHVDLRIGGAQDTDYAGFDTLTGIENVIGSNNGGDLLVGNDGANVLKGLGGADNLQGNGGNDSLYGGLGNDTLSGGSGDDLFVFTSGDGQDTVLDFLAGAASGDVIALQGYGVSTFAALQSFMTQSGADTVIAFGAQNQIVLHGVQLAQLDSGDFLFG